MDQKTLDCIKVSIIAILDAKKEDGSFLMTIGRCWMAIYRVLADMGFTKKDKFKDFERLVKNVLEEHSPRLSVNGKDLLKLSYKNYIFRQNHKTWLHNNGTYTKKVFQEYREIAFTFHDLLLEEINNYEQNSCTANRIAC